MDSNDEEDEAPSGTNFKKADLYKMHTYRDAIRGCRGAYVLYPGDETRIFSVSETREGVGAISCCMDGENGTLKRIIESLVLLGYILRSEETDTLTIYFDCQS